MKDLAVFEFQKNSAETVKVTLAQFKGAVYLSLRVWWNERPTRKGLTVHVELFPELERAALRKALAAKGLLSR